MLICFYQDSVGVVWSDLLVCNQATQLSSYFDIAKSWSVHRNTTPKRGKTKTLSYGKNCCNILVEDMLMLDTIAYDKERGF